METMLPKEALYCTCKNENLRAPPAAQKYNDLDSEYHAMGGEDN